MTPITVESVAKSSLYLAVLGVALPESLLLQSRSLFRFSIKLYQRYKRAQDQGFAINWCRTVSSLRYASMQSRDHMAVWVKLEVRNVAARQHSIRINFLEGFNFLSYFISLNKYIRVRFISIVSSLKVIYISNTYHSFGQDWDTYNLEE